MTRGTVARQAPLSMGGGGVPIPPPGDLPDLRIQPMSPALAGGFFITESLGKPAWY